MLQHNRIIRNALADTNLFRARKDQSPNVHRRHQIVCKIGKRTGNSNTDNEDIQSEYSNGIQYRKICHANNQKREMTTDGNEKTIFKVPQKNDKTTRNQNI